MPKEKKAQRPYIDVNVLRDREPYMNEALENPEIATRLDIDNFNKTLSGLGAWIIDQFLLQNTGFHWTHYNLDSDGVKIMNRVTKEKTQIYFKPEGIQCETCERGDCEHVKFALTVDAIKAVIREKKKEGWKLPDV
jgi:hypothetical protein